MLLREWWRRLLRRGELEAGLDEEIRFHIERQTEKNVRLGMSAGEAHRQAVLRFGGVERLKETTRDEFRALLLEDITRDVKYGVRSLLRAPGFALVSVLTLGLGIGAATAVFSVVHGVLLRPLPYPQSERIVRLLHVDDDGPKRNVSEPNFLDWRAQSRSFRALAVMAPQGRVSVTGSVEPNRAIATVVSHDFFAVMGVQPAVGRGFAAEELQQHGRPAVIVSHSYWLESLGGRQDFENVALTQGEAAFAVVGVMPPGFDYPYGTQLWVPRELHPPDEGRTAHNFQAIARLADHATVASAARELSAISRALRARYGDDTWMTDATVITLQQDVTGRVRSTLLILLGAAGFLLVIACANVSNLLLVRAGSRRREMAVRLAIGAGRWRVARQLLTESVVLCLAGAAAGVVLAYWGVHSLLALDPGNLPRAGEVGVNWIVLAFAVLVALAIAAVLALITVLRQNVRDLRGALSEGQRSAAGGRRQQRVRDALVVTQVALTLVLLTGASLLGRSFLQVLAIDPGYRIDEALVLDLAMEYPQNEQSAARQTRIHDELMEQLRRLPGVTAVGGVNDFPLGAGWFATGQFIEMNAPDEITSFEDFSRFGAAELKARAGLAGYRVASEDYFEAMGIRLLRGRLFESGDVADAPHVAVISQTLADTRWAGQDPIGRYIQFGNMDGDLRGMRIIGVVSDVRENSLEAAPGALLYASSRQRAGSAARFSIVVRGTDSPAAIQAAQRIVRQVEPQLPVAVRTARTAYDASLAGRKFSLVLLGVFSAAALVLAAMGLYGVISWVVSQRTREIGIRVALGADAASLIAVVIGRGALLAAIGAGIGLLAALLLGRLVQGMLFGVAATDPLTLLAVVALIGSAVLIASYLPARRALRVAPSITLRAE
ncbi:MAG TPA: ABC transporter permease [Longimicrobiales bacterium]|nr:ABC transporter permease [Longimicrobiales bacterium]